MRSHTAGYYAEKLGMRLRGAGGVGPGQCEVDLRLLHAYPATEEESHKEGGWMRKLVLLVGLCMLGVMSFGTLAWAQDPCPDPNYPRYTPDGCQASDLPDVVFGPAASATPTATATPGPVEPLTAAPAATATAAPTATATATAAATGDPTGGSAALPETGGLSALSLAALGLLVAGGLLARRLVRS